MEKTHLYALTTVVALSLALVFTYGSAESPAQVEHTGPRVLSSIEGYDDLPFFIFGTAANAVYFSEAEVELIQVAMDEYAATTTTAPPSKRSNPEPAPSPTSPTTTSPPSPPTTIKAGFRADYEADFYGRINSLRSANGLPALTLDGSLNARARDWAKHLAEIGYLKHSNLASLLPPWTGAAENLGAGASVSSVFNALAGSSGHRANMVGNYTHAGIAAWVDSSGTIWTVHVFTRG